VLAESKVGVTKLTCSALFLFKNFLKQKYISELATNVLKLLGGVILALSHLINLLFSVSLGQNFHPLFESTVFYRV
jgi:hypothetical protein